MLKEKPESLTGNDRFEGYSVDLIHEISLILGKTLRINHKFTPLKYYLSDVIKILYSINSNLSRIRSTSNALITTLVFTQYF